LKLSVMTLDDQLDYERLAADYPLILEVWDPFVRALLVDEWIAAYRAMSTWTTEVLEIAQRELTFLFDAAPTLNEVSDLHADDRVVAVWGHSHSAAHRRDRTRLAGFLPNPSSWSRFQLDRGNLVAHAAGGGLDVNLIPQAMSLNRGRSPQGRSWREMEAYAARHPGTPLLVRPNLCRAELEPGCARLRAACRRQVVEQRFVNAA
jgi:hypothetical protein